MQTTVEQIIEAARRLPPEELRKLEEWIQSRKRENVSAEGVEIDEEIRLRRMQWLKANRERYGGSYVVLDGDKFLGAAGSYPEAHKIAQAAGAGGAFINYLSRPDEEDFTGGW